MSRISDICKYYNVGKDTIVNLLRYFPEYGRVIVSVSTMTYCVVQINCLPLPRFLKEVTMKTAEERYEETWNSYLELLNTKISEKSDMAKS